MRSLPDPGFAGDDGSADPALAAALAAYDAEPDSRDLWLSALAALQDARVLVPRDARWPRRAGPTWRPS